MLRLSLEKLLRELPQDHPKHAAIKDELVLGTSPSYASPRKQTSAVSYSSFFKPACLTGRCLKKMGFTYLEFFFSFLKTELVTEMSFLRSFRGMFDGLPGAARVNSRP